MKNTYNTAASVKTSLEKKSPLSLNKRPQKNEALKVLSEEQWAFWKHNGYVIIKKAISKKQAEKTARFLWDFEEKKAEDPITWFAPPRAEMQMKELVGTGMVEVYHHQLLWDNRQSLRIYNAFVDIWGTEKLWVTIDRANLNFPLQNGQLGKGFIHWDYDPEKNPVNVQGVLALADQMDKNMGGFQCIPWLYRNFKEWKNSQPKDRNHFMPDITGLEDEIEKVSMQTGDLLIFNSLLPHGIRPNKSKNKVRIAQYISMTPAQEENTSLREWRINSWDQRIPPAGYAFPGDPRKWEQTKYDRAKLNDHGRKLLGLDKW